MIVVPVFFLILNRMEFLLVQSQKQNCSHDHIPLNLKGNGNIVFSVMVGRVKKMWMDKKKSYTIFATLDITYIWQYSGKVQFFVCAKMAHNPQNGFDTDRQCDHSYFSSIVFKIKFVRFRWNQMKSNACKNNKQFIEKSQEIPSFTDTFGVGFIFSISPHVNTARKIESLQ